MVRKPTRRGIRRRSTRHRSGGTVYQNDTALDHMTSDDTHADQHVDVNNTLVAIPEWQAGEREASAQIAAGETEFFDSDKAFLAALDAIESDD